MSSKKISPKANRYYFADARDYNKVVDAERVFFEGLVKAQNDIPTNPSLQKALSDAAPFLQDCGRRLEIVVEFSVHDPRTRAPQTIKLGTRLIPPQPQAHALATHYFCLADSESLLTKFHADFDFNHDAAEKKPSPHLQSGGRVYKELMAVHSHSRPKVWWNEKVDKPRMPALPFCTALLWHWAFLEYQTSDQIAQFLKAWHWRNLVKRAEGAVLKPFFEDGIKLLERDPDAGVLNAFYVPVAK